MAASRQLIYLALALLTVAAPDVSAGTTETRAFLSFTSNQIMYLDGHNGARLLCDELGLGYGVGGVCFDIPASATSIELTGRSTFGIPYAAIFWLDSEGAYLESGVSCLRGDQPTYPGAAKMIVFIFAPWDGNPCPAMEGVGAFAGAAGTGTVTARFA